VPLYEKTGQFHVQLRDCKPHIEEKYFSAQIGIIHCIWDKAYQQMATMYEQITGWASYSKGLNKIVLVR